MKNNKKGFTLAELLIVVAIIAVLVAISIPIFSAQLEKSRDAVTVANLRSAYAEAAVEVLTSDDPSVGVTKDVVSKGTQTGWSDVEGDLPFTLDSSLDDLQDTPSTYSVTFTWSGDDCTASIS